MTPLNDEAISGHQLWEKGLRNTQWAAVVRESELIDGLERPNRVHPNHGASPFQNLTHYILPLKECVVEVVPREVAVHRVEGTTAEATLQARR